MALSDNLIVYYKMDEASGNALDAHTVGPYDLTDNNTVGTGTGIISNARDLEETADEYFSLTDNADISVGDIDFSWTVWVNAESLVNGIILSKFKEPPGSDNDCEYRIWYDGSRFKFTIGNGSSNAQVTANTFGAPSTATWYFIVIWHDSVNNVIGISVNDTADTAAYSVGGQNTAGALYVGTQTNVIGNASFQWDGLIDEMGFWKRVLSSAEITELYNGGAGRTYEYITAAGGASPPEVPYRLRGGGIAEIAFPAWQQAFRFQ